MTEEEARDLAKGSADLKEQAAQKDRRREEREAHLMRPWLRLPAGSPFPVAWGPEEG